MEARLLFELAREEEKKEVGESGSNPTEASPAREDPVDTQSCFTGVMGVKSVVQLRLGSEECGEDGSSRLRVNGVLARL